VSSEHLLCRPRRASTIEECTSKALWAYFRFIVYCVSWTNTLNRFSNCSGRKKSNPVPAPPYAKHSCPSQCQAGCGNVTRLDVERDEAVIMTENQLDEWVRGNSRDAQAVIVELVWRLVAASAPQPKERRFPLGDSIGQHGPDGFLDVDFAFDPFVPEGRSFWEIGTGIRAGDKATSDYSGLVSTIPEAIRLESTFVFVTPLSGRRDWEHTWKEDAQGAWLAERRAKGDWREVKVVDGTKLVDWIAQFPAVELWLLQRTLGQPIQHLDTPEQRWALVSSIGEPPPLTTHLFLSGQEEACAKLDEVVAGTSVQLKLETHFPNRVVDFVSAFLSDLESEARVDAAGRCVVVTDANAWNSLSALKEKLILIADSSLDMSGESGTKLIQKARRSGHAVIFGGPAGGIPDPASAPLRMPRTQQVREALEHAGYNEERARTLAQRSGGNLGSLLRCLQNLSLLPEWAVYTDASELAIATMLGAWTEDSVADRGIVEDLAGKSYGEWIGRMREVMLRPGTPLTHRDGVWKFRARYEGWYALGPKLFDEHLDRLQSTAASVLMERDPQFDLPKDERYASSIHGKAIVHSHVLRNGLAESIALLGSHPKALTSCTLGKAELTATLAVRQILADADWERWAGLNDLLPLLAEAAPGEFLDAVENALISEPCPFDGVYAEEGDGFMGRTYMSGLLWALETLAWDPKHLSRVVVALGELAARDPGGRWSNRPSNSLTTILLPWFPQTCAPIAKRAAAVAALFAELPEVGWKLLMSLLPQSHSASSGTRKPAWRETIPEDWLKGVTHSEFWEQTALYSEMAITAARADRNRLIELIGHMENMSPPAQEQLLSLLSSEATTMLPEADRLGIWNELVALVIRHRKYPDARWAMQNEQIDRITTIANRLAPQTPQLRHQRLFSENVFQLLEEKGDFDEQVRELQRRRRQAIEDIAVNGGAESILDLAAAVESPWQVGIAAAAVAGLEIDELVLPDLLDSNQEHLAQFAAGYTRNRYFVHGWTWVDAIDTTRWPLSHVGQFLSFLPFSPGTWERATRLLGPNEIAYWGNTSANAFEAEADLTVAIERLITYERPIAALRCFYVMLHDKQPIDVGYAVRALLAAVRSEEGAHSMDVYQTVEIIKALQANPSISPDDLFRVEWAYLPLLDGQRDAVPKLLWQRLATEPRFFCEVIRLVFRSRKENHPSEELTKEKQRIATNGYNLLREWATPPGSQADGTYDGGALIHWLNAVKKECTETGHCEIAMTMLGHSLIHTPPDPDGLWIHRSAAKALNARDAEDMRNGFRAELYNSRGVHWGDPTGAPERALAAKYSRQAEAVEQAGYQRFAATLRDLAASYEREADYVVSKDRVDE